MTDSASDEPRFLLARLTPAAGQRRRALIAAAISILAFAFAAGFAAVRLPEIDMFNRQHRVSCAQTIFSPRFFFFRNSR